ncbi:developmental regulator flbA [Colletotrichum orchidophilum]|uniref:Developmental regulator flbA n=1 Tax=Colletotrichum orchidophilum TaxID=1209926 RepID=A0A1G4BNJ4_9PEZI|nr:developmental regulator flbA [Colletotrichum orchidophilum]OHF02873.1 developmental regulator flbA [Colletotrichum orchidophilum]
MPRPTTDRVIHDYTAKILPTAMILILIIFTVVVLVYSIGERAAVPENAAVAFAGIVFGVSGPWLMGHLVIYCRGAQAVSPPPLALTGIATGVGATTMAIPSVPQVPPAATAGVAVPPTVLQPQQQFQRLQLPQRLQYQEQAQQQGYPPQAYTYSQPQIQSRQQTLPPRQEEQPRQRREEEVPVTSEQQQQHECQRRQTQLEPAVKGPPYPASPPGLEQEGSRVEHGQQEPQQQIEQQQGQSQPPIQQVREMPQLLENVWQKRPSVPGNQATTTSVPDPVKQRQQPMGPRIMTARQPVLPERGSSLQRSFSGTKSRRHRSQSLSSPRLYQTRQLSRGSLNRERPARGRCPADAAEATVDRGRSRADCSRPEPYDRDVEPEPGSASVRSTSLDSATRASLKPAPLTITKQHRAYQPSTGDERPSENLRDASLPSRQVDQLESNPQGREAQSRDTAGGTLPTIRCVPATPPNAQLATVQPAQGNIRRSFDSLSRQPLPDSRDKVSDSCGKPRSSMIDLQTNVVFLPNYTITASRLLDLEHGENGSLCFLWLYERQEQAVGGDEKLIDGRDWDMMCSPG